MAQNPYLSAQQDAITNQVNRNLQTNVLPGISSGAIQAGGYGGSRQGVAEGLAVGQSNQDLSNALANLQGTNYQQDQQNSINLGLGLGNLGVQSQGQQLNYQLGLGSQGLQNQQQNLNFYTQQRGLDQTGAQLGANLYNQGNQGYLGQATGVTGIGNTIQQAPWNVLGQAGNLFNQYTGLGGSTVGTQSGSPLGGAVGGALAGAQLGQNLGLNNYTNPNSTGSYTNLQGNGVPDNAYDYFYGGGP